MRQKSGFVAFLLWCGGFFLLAGLHRIYLGRFWTGVLWFCTLGLFGVGQLIDLFRLGDMVRKANAEGISGPNLKQTNNISPVFNVTVHASPAAIGTNQSELFASPVQPLLPSK